MTGPAIIALTPGGLATARRVARALGGAELHGRTGRAEPADVGFDDTRAHLEALFAAGRPIVGICAAGILIRILGPLLADKHDEPPVVAVAEDASAVVPLIGGHRGANDLARIIAAEFAIAPSITTASDLVLGLALDAPPPGYTLANPQSVGEFTQRLLAGEPVRIIGEAPWLNGARIERDNAAALTIHVTEKAQAGAADCLVYYPATLAVGIGAERGADPQAALTLMRETLAEAGLAEASVALVASLDLKEDEPAIGAVAEALCRPARYFTADRLEAETPRLANPSKTVFRAVGCHGVAEAAALAAAGPKARLVATKRVGDRATCAVARADEPIDAATVGRARGRLAIVGLGPGDAASRTGEASALLASADDLVGYHLYLDLAGPVRAGQRRHDFALGEEEARVAHALTLAAKGRCVALVSSGDPGIYAMAALAFELIECGAPEWRRIAVTVAPGISALQAAAARAGAPLGHDFCAISLSDLMTPAEIIERRLKAAASGDFVIALYNPASTRRRALLDRAIAILRAERPADTPVIIARNLGRPKEQVDVTSLGNFDATIVDMLTIVLIGSSTTRVIERGDGGAWVYTPRGYAVSPDVAAGDAA